MGSLSFSTTRAFFNFPEMLIRAAVIFLLSASVYHSAVVVDIVTYTHDQSSDNIALFKRTAKC